MASVYFQDLLSKSTGLDRNKLQGKSVDWLRKAAMRVSQTNPSYAINTKEPFKRIVKISESSIGKMYLFTYSAKHKDTLPYWDRFPLIFPIEYYSDGFLGINLHYLPPMLRARLMDTLRQTANNNKLNKTTKLRISYEILKGAAKYRYFKPCVKRYLFSHVASNFLYISPDEWDIALMLPMQSFQTSTRPYITAEEVYKDSIEKAK